MFAALLFAVWLLEPHEINGIEISAEGESKVIDPAEEGFVFKVTIKSPHGVEVTPPDLGKRTYGFSSADYIPPKVSTDERGRTVQVIEWMLDPEPYADEYKIKPFEVRVSPPHLSFRNDPIKFVSPSLDPVPGTMEGDDNEDKSLWDRCLEAAALLAVIGVVIFLVRRLEHRVKEHFMSPIERARVELERLLKRGLPGRGRYKDFYVELTMVVRRYIQRKYGIRAPQLTTEEFLAECGATDGRVGDTAALRIFLESADMVKFAGLESTPEMADEATDSARKYLECDSAEEAK